MAKPATEARLAAAANGFTQVLARGNSHIITKNPTTGKCAYDGQVGGGWHYNGDQETDTAWVADSDTNYLKMVKAGYNLRSRKLFNAGDLIRCIDPVSGQYVKFQPTNFQWIDGTTGSNSLISVAQAISAPTIDDDKLYWPAAFGTGRHFQYIASPTRLIKHLIIDSAANLPACPAYITNPWLELTFTLTPSTGVVMYVDGVAWDHATTKTTANAIEFRLPSGQVVWQLAAPTAYDSSRSIETGQCAGQIRLYVKNKIKYCSVRFPKAWIDTAQFPIMLDPTVNYQTSNQADDGIWAGTSFQTGDNNMYCGCFSVIYSSYSRWTGVTIPDGATIDTSYLSFCADGDYGTPPECKIYFEDAANPAAPIDLSDATSRVKTTAYKNYTYPKGTAAGTWHNTDSINDVISELMGSFSFASGAAMMMIIVGSGSGLNCGFNCAYNKDAASAAKLHIEYTEAAGGNPFYAYAQQ